MQARQARRLQQAGSLAVLAGLPAWLVYWAPTGLDSPFSPDDMMNLFGAWDLGWRRLMVASLSPWTTVYRPVGGLMYVGLFEVFGWNPYPYRVACYLLLGVNAWLAFRLVLRLTENWPAALLTGLAAAYHVRLVGLYADTGRIYDVLGATFSLACFTLYFSLASRRRTWFTFLLLVLALETKESAAALPVILLVFEAAGGRRPPWLVWVLAATAACVMWAKTGPGSALHNHPAYMPELSWSRAETNLSGYWSQLLYQPNHSLDELAVLLGLALLAALALTPRSAVRLGAGWALIGLGPLLFIDERDFGAVYFSHLGLAVLAGGLVSAAFELQPLRRGWVQVGVAAWLAMVLVKQHRIARVRTPTPADWARTWPDVDGFRGELLTLVPQMEADAVVRFRTHRFEEDWMPLFILKPTYGSREIHVSIDRTVGAENAPPDVDYLFEEGDGGLRLVE